MHLVVSGKELKVRFGEEGNNKRLSNDTDWDSAAGGNGSAVASSVA